MRLSHLLMPLALLAALILAACAAPSLPDDQQCERLDRRLGYCLVAPSELGWQGERMDRVQVQGPEGRQGFIAQLRSDDESLLLAAQSLTGMRLFRMHWDGSELDVDGEFPEAGPIMLQDHGDVLHFRNIWVRPLPPRPVEGGEGSKLSPEATAEKRSEIAAGIRAHAATLEGRQMMMRYLESLAYEVDEDAMRTATTMAAAEAAGIGEMDGDELEENKAGILEFERALDYLVRFDVLPEDEPSRVKVNTIVEEQGWNER